MRLRIIVFVLLGMLIGGSIAVPLINSECERCGGGGKLECPACAGTGVALHYFYVECHCGGQPDCPVCHGVGHYPHITTKPCEYCDGNGWTACPDCRGDGRRNLLERIPDLGKPKHWK